MRRLCADSCQMMLYLQPVLETQVKCTLQDLCADDKQKVAGLLKQVGLAHPRPAAANHLKLKIGQRLIS